MSFRKYLVDKKLITQDDFDKIMDVYNLVDPDSGKKKLFEDIAVDLGIIDNETKEREFLKYCQEN